MSLSEACEGEERRLAWKRVVVGLVPEGQTSLRSLKPWRSRSKILGTSPPPLFLNPFGAVRPILGTNQSPI